MNTRTLTGVLAASAAAIAFLAGPAIASADSKPPTPPKSPAPASHNADKSPTPTTVKKSALGAPSFSQINCWDGVADGATLPWYGAPVAGQQPVVASAVEANAGGRGEFIGAAHVSVEGVAVVPNAVLVRVRTGWNSPLAICVHYVG